MPSVVHPTDIMVNCSVLHSSCTSSSWLLEIGFPCTVQDPVIRRGCICIVITNIHVLLCYTCQNLMRDLELTFVYFSQSLTIDSNAGATNISGSSPTMDGNRTDEVFGEIDISRLTVGECLGNGEFGSVLKGIWLSPSGDKVRDNDIFFLFLMRLLFPSYIVSIFCSHL